MSSTSPSASLNEQRIALLEKENDRLLKLIAAQQRELAELRGEGAEQLELEIARLKENLSRAMDRLYGDSSEKLPVEDGGRIAPPPQRRGHGPRAQPKLPVEEVVIDLPAEERACPSCDGELEPMTGQFEESEQVSYLERLYVLKKVRRQKYRCRCQGAVVTAPAPTTHMPGGRYSLDFAAGIVVDKYQDHIPLDRQARRMGRLGLEVTPQALWNQVDRLRELLTPVHRALRLSVCSSDLVHADETSWRFMGQRKGKRRHAWSISDGECAYFDFERGRSADDAARILEGFDGALVCDGYSAYGTLARGSPGIRLVGCWAHVRRKFKEAEKGHPTESREGLERIARLYQAEHLRPDVSGLEGDELADARELDAHVRGFVQRAIVEELRQWTLTLRASKQSALAQAVAYMLGRWEELTRFIDDPALPLDNNEAERRLRTPVVGRKVYYGSRSLDGLRAAGVFYSIIETCKMQGVDPQHYLIAACKAAIETGTVLLPSQLR